MKDKNVIFIIRIVEALKMTKTKLKNLQIYANQIHE
jgi:hypothetical protein